MEKRESIQSPINRQAGWLQSAAGGRCDFFEKQWINCATQLGLTRAEKECGFFKEDLKQCGEMGLSIKRYHRMQEERQKKGLPYQDPPPYDTLMYEKFKQLVF